MAPAGGRDVSFKVTAKGTVHRGMQEFDEPEMHELEDGITDKVRDERAKEMALRQSAAQVLEFSQKERSMAATHSRNTLNSAAGMRMRDTNSLTVAAATRNEVDLETVTAIKEEAARAEEEQMLRQLRKYSMWGDGDNRSEAGVFHDDEVSKHHSNALAVVVARSNHRGSVEAGEEEGIQMHHGLPEFQANSRMMQVQHFPSRAGERRINVRPDNSGYFGVTGLAALALGDGAPAGDGGMALPSGSRIGGTELGSPARRSMISRLRRGLARAASSRATGGGRWFHERRLSSFDEDDYDDDPDGRPRRKKPARDVHVSTHVEGARPSNWREMLLATYPDSGMPSNRLNQRFAIVRGDFVSDQQKADQANKKDDTEEEQGDEGQVQDKRRICPTCSVSPVLPKDMDQNMTSVHADLVAVRFPNDSWAPPVQMWEPFIISLVLSLMYFQDFTGAEREDDIVKEDQLPNRLSWHERHVEKFLKFTKKQLKMTFPCPLLRDHIAHPYLRHEETRFFKFMAVFLRKKFEPYEFKATHIADYVKSALFENMSSPDGRTQRIYITAPWVLDFMRNEPTSLLKGQYAELLVAARAVGLAVHNIVDFVKDKTTELAKQVWSAVIEQSEMPQLDYDQVHRYLDNNLIQRRYGGFSLQPEEPIVSHTDGLLLRKVGATLEDIITGRTVEAAVKAESLRRHQRAAQKESRVEKLREERRQAQLLMSNKSASFHSFFSNELAVDPSATSNPASREHKSKANRPATAQNALTEAEEEDERLRKEEEEEQLREEWEELVGQCIDPEDTRFQPLGFSLAEFFLLIHGMVLAMDRRPDADGDGKTDTQEGHQRVLRTHMNATSRDRHVLAAALLIDLYMREKIDMWAWQVDDLPTDQPSAKRKSKKKAEQPDPWTGAISNIYRVFAPEDAPLWTTEVPMSHDTTRKPHAHWLEVYVQMAEEIFHSMQIPAFLAEEPIWDAAIERNMLQLTEEEADQYKLLEKKFWQMLEKRYPMLSSLLQGARSLLGRCCPCCCKRRDAQANHRLHRHEWNFGQGIQLPSDKVPHRSGSRWLKKLKSGHDPDNNHQRPAAEVYEFVPPPLPDQLYDGPVGGWLEEVEERRLAARQTSGPGPPSRTYKVGDKVETFSESQQKWVKAKITKVSRGWVTVLFKKEGGGRSSKELPHDHELVRPREKKVKQPLPPVAEDDEGDDDEDGEDEEGDQEDGQESKEESGHGSKDAADAASNASSSGTKGSAASGADGGDGHHSRVTGSSLSAITEGSGSQGEESSTSTSQTQSLQDEAAEDEDYEGAYDSMAEWNEWNEHRKAWWERLKMLYCDSYFLMFEEGAIYFEDDQEIAMWRAQLLMFFFCLQLLFEVAWESRNGFERVVQAFCPPFAKLPLQPPRGMEAAGAIIRGIIERARLAGEERADAVGRNLAVEAGEFQEKMRERFEHELYTNGSLIETFDSGSDGAVSLEEFITGIQDLPLHASMRTSGMPKQVLNTVIRDLASELFFQIDRDGSGTLTKDEIKAAMEERAREVAERRKKMTSFSVAQSQISELRKQIPGTAENKQWKESEKARLQKVRAGYETFKNQRKMRAQAAVAQDEFAMARAQSMHHRVSLNSDDLEIDEEDV